MTRSGFAGSVKKMERKMKRIKIKKVFIDPVNVDLDEPFKIAIGTKYNIENAIVTVVLDNGIEGYGEAAPLEPINYTHLRATRQAEISYAVFCLKKKKKKQQ